MARGWRIIRESTEQREKGTAAMTLDDYYRMEQDRKVRRISLGPDMARRSDSGRTCRDCGREFRPTDGNRYCDDCKIGKGR
jgi:hypothetical protein